jgi:tetratricopeptide (TPR) repeat protein
MIDKTDRPAPGSMPSPKWFFIIGIAVGMPVIVLLALSDHDAATRGAMSDGPAYPESDVVSRNAAPSGPLPPSENFDGERAPDEVAGSEAATCESCHSDIVEQWARSHHALANRWIGQVDLAPGEIVYGDVRTRIDGDMNVLQDGVGDFDYAGRPVAVLGVDPLVQPILEFPSGHWQVFNPAFHPGSGTWFNAFPEVREAGEWGHWTGRAMNWNTQCAWCHMTGFEKNYDIETDSYASEWTEMGISCAQCHGDLAAHAADPKEFPASLLDRPSAQENCLTCHSRREFLTAERFEPGEEFSDHFRLALFNQPGIYYPDGQVLSENFVGGSFLASSMHDAGVTCFDCHVAHSNELIAPVENNALCLTCHQSPGNRGAPPIEPVAHSFHDADSEGNRCVECHMPKTQYMESDLRRDHGFTSPDPMLTRVLEIPNACNRCHEDQTVDWAESHAEDWYGDALAQRPARALALAIDAAWSGEPDAGPRLLALARNQENAVWQATLVALMREHIANEGVQKHVLQSLDHEHELVRSAAVRSLAPYPQFRERLAALQRDPSRLVRIDAAWATLERGAVDDTVDMELREWLDFNADQPAGALSLARAALREERLPTVPFWIERMLALDGSAGAQVMAGRLYHASGDLDSAARAFETATDLDAGLTEAWLLLGMLYAERGELASAASAFDTVTGHEPNNGRAWYNLGLARLQLGDLEQGMAALRRAEELTPNSADPAYAMALVLGQTGDLAAARRVLQRALQRDPDHAPSRELLQQITR